MNMLHIVEGGMNQADSLNIQNTLYLLANTKQLPQAPILERYWLQNPYLLVICIIVLGIACFVTGQRSENQRQRTIGLVCFPIAIILLLISQFVTTSREVLINQTQIFFTSGVNSAGTTQSSKQSFATFQNMLTKNIRFSIMGLGLNRTKEQIIEMVTTNVNAYQVQNISFHNMQALISESGTQGQSQVTIHSKVTKGSFHRSVRTTFRINWEQHNDTWSVQGIDFLDLNGQDVPAGIWQQ